MEEEEEEERNEWQRSARRGWRLQRHDLHRAARRLEEFKAGRSLH